MTAKMAEKLFFVSLGISICLIPISLYFQKTFLFCLSIFSGIMASVFLTVYESKGGKTKKGTT